MVQEISRIWHGWEIVQPIGRGSFGSVYQIQRTICGSTETAALKVISIPKDRDEIQQLRSDGYDDHSITQYFLDSREKIESEYALMANLKGHTNIVYCDDIHTIAHEDGFGWDIYIKMELLTPMKKHLTRPVPEKQVIKLGMDICNALTLCQDLKIVHRDIKPDNIFVSRNGSYKLGDFGIAKTMEGTHLGTKTGTYDYMAPEVYCNQPYHVQADIYSLGLVMYWMLNNFATPFLPTDGTRPTPSMKMSACARRFRGETLPPPVSGSPKLQHIVLKACAFDQKQRYQSAGEMLKELNMLAAENAASAVEETHRERIVDTVLADDDITVREVRLPKEDDDKTVRDSGSRRKPAPEIKPAKEDKPVKSGNNPATAESDPVPQDNQSEDKRTNRRKKKGKKQKKTKNPETRAPKKFLIFLGLFLLIDLAAFLIFTALSAPRVTVTSTYGDDSYALTRIGFIDDPDRAMYIDDDVLVKEYFDDSLVIWYNYLGAMSETICMDVSYLGQGLYAARTASTDVNSVTLMTGSGDRLLPQKACMIEWASGQSETDPRYLLVYYADTVTTDESNFLICADSKGFVSTYKNGGTLYTGHVQVYDTQSWRFVPGLPKVTDNSNIQICGNSILIRQDSGNYVLYDQAGTVLLDMKYAPTVDGGCLVTSRDGTYYLYDDTGAQLYASNKYFSLVYGSAYIRTTVNSVPQVMDSRGKLLFDSIDVSRSINGSFVSTDDSKKGLVSVSGQEILPCSYSYIFDAGMGFTCAEYNGKYTLVNEDGVVAVDLDKSPSNLVIRKDNQLYVINNRAFDLSIGNAYPTVLAEALICVSSGNNGMYGVYDLFTGNLLLPFEYEKICYAADYLYAYKNSGWEVYAVSCTRS